MTLINTTPIHNHRKEMSFFPVTDSCFENTRIAAAVPTHAKPIIVPVKIPESTLSLIGIFTSFFSSSRNAAVKTSITTKGISSAKNLHTAGFSLGTSMTPDRTAHPIKKTTTFKAVIKTFSYFLRHNLFYHSSELLFHLFRSFYSNLSTKSKHPAKENMINCNTDL